jgi:hypothetical protein
MARDFQIFGECLVRVRGSVQTATWVPADIPPSGSLSGGVIVSIPATSGVGLISGGISEMVDLGLCEGPITVRPRFFHKPMRVDDFGPYGSPEVMWNLAECDVEMTLIHYDREILDIVVSESMAGSISGFLIGCGVPMGGGLPLYASGNHYVSVNLLPPPPDGINPYIPYFFPSCYLAEPPVVIPLGTTRSSVMLNWKAIPYTYPVPESIFTSSGGAQMTYQEILSSGSILWNNSIE